MPTRYKRIAVVADPELEAALDAVSPIFPDRPAASVVRLLAIRGAEELAREEEKRAAAIEWLIERSTSLDGLDREALERVKEDAWGF